MQDQTKVPVGTSTVAGYTVTATSVVAAILAYTGGDHSQATTGVIMAGILAVVSLAITQVGRYVQAHELVKQAARSSVVISTPREVVERALAPVLVDTEPGDPHDALPHHPVTDPASIPPDQGDGGAGVSA